MDLAVLFCAGAAGIGLGAGLFAVATLTAAMSMPARGAAGQGLALGAWGAAQATAAGLAVATGGILRDLVGAWAGHDAVGTAFDTPAIGYTFVYHLEIVLLFATLIVLGPLVRTTLLQPQSKGGTTRLEIAEFPT
jgi:BCD family chlorophyll transporter-like MFS transporter